MNISEEELKKLVLAQEKVAYHLREKEILKTIIVPNKLVNLVVK